MEELPTPIEIVISDDHPVFREGLRKLLEAERGFRIVAEASDGEETVKVVRQHKPRILLLDLSMPKGTGLETLRALSQLGIQTRTILLTASIEKEQVIEALQLGARGIVLKHSTLQVILKSIRCVNDDQFWIGQDSTSDLIQALQRMMPQHRAAETTRNFGLTARELQVVALIVAGYTNKDLARKLGISEHTSKHHLTNIFDKLGVSNRLELVLFAINHQLIKQD
ncbi:MAG: response regulator transcription factor [Terriglobia bacterium]|jgi:DNA-binding NarL/FixJ family response regulator